MLKLVYFYVSKAFFSQTHPFGIKKGRFRLKNDLKMKKTPKKMDVFFFWRHHPESNRGIKVLQTSALPLGYGAVFSFSKNRTLKSVFKRPFSWSGLRGSNPLPPPWQGGALPDELNPHKWCLRSESNQRHGDFQSPALPTELQRQMATWMGLEPTTSSVTG